MFRLPAFRSARRAVTLRCEPLEARDVPAVTLAPIADQNVPDNKPIFLPVTVTNTPAGAVTTTVTSSAAGLTAQVITGGQSVRFTISGTDSSGNPFTGDLVLRLFPDVAPVAVQRVIDLVNDGYYDGKLIHRVLNNFVIQGGSPTGDGTGGSTLPDFNDEFDSAFQFDSPGVLAMANSGDDTNNAQFFITDPKVLAASRPEAALNFNYTALGILTSGFDTFQKAITTNVTTQPNGTEDSRPVDDITITNATVFTDPSNAVIELAPTGAFPAGTASTITVSADDGSGSPGTATFTVTGQDDAVNNRAFLGPISNPVTVEGVPTTVAVPVTDTENDATTLVVRDATFTTAPANVTVSVNQSTHQITLTPDAGFTGTVQFKIGVRDQTDRSGTGNLDDASNYDTDLYTLTVNPSSSLAVTLTASPTTTLTNATVVLTAAFSGGASPDGTVAFVSNGTSIGQAAVSGGQATLTTTFATAGDQSITAQYTPAGQSSPLATSPPVTVTVTAPTSPPPPVSPPSPPVSPPASPPTTTSTTLTITAEGSPAGGSPRVTVRNADGSVRFGLLAFDETFTGGVLVAVGDVNGDGIEDVVAVPGAGGGAVVRAFSGDDGHEIFSKLVFEDTFRGGLNVAVGAAAGVGYDQIVVGAGRGGAPRVALLDAKLGTTVLDYFAHDSTQRGGASVSLADLVNAGRDQILTGELGTNTAAEVAVVDPLNGAFVGSTTVGGPLVDSPAAPEVSLRRFLASSPPAPTVPPPPAVYASAGDSTPSGDGRAVNVSTFDGTTLSPPVSIDPTTFVDKTKLAASTT